MIPPQLFAIGGGALLMAGLLGGWTLRDWKADADALAAQRAREALRVRMQSRIDAQAGRFERARQAIDLRRDQTRATIREIYHDIPVPVDCALRPDALGVLEDARERANAAAAGQSGESVPATARADPAARS